MNKIELLIEIDARELIKAKEKIDKFFAPHGQLHIILQNTANATKHKIQDKVLEGKRLITGEGRTSVEKSDKYSTRYFADVKYTEKQARVFLGFKGVGTTKIDTPVSGQFLSVIRTDTTKMEGSYINKLFNPETLIGKSGDNLRIPSKFAETVIPQYLGIRKRVKKLPTNYEPHRDESFVTIDLQTWKNKQAKKFTRINKVIFKRDKKANKLIPVVAQYQTADYQNNNNKYGLDHLTKYINDFIPIVEKQSITTLTALLKRK
ncbi:MAG: hypothetical protein ACRC0X_02030 [Brevinema sp.]